MNPITRNTPLLAVLEEHYFAARFVREDGHGRNRYYTGIKWLASYLKREPVVSDLCQATIDATAQHYRARGRRDGTLVSFEHFAVSLWRFCHEQGALDAAPKRRKVHPVTPRVKRPRDPNFWGGRKQHKGHFPRPQMKKQILRERVEQPADASATVMDLLRYYAWRKLRGGDPSTFSKFRGAIRRLSDELQREALISDLTNENLEGVMWSAREAGKAIPTCDDARKKLAALWTFAHKAGIVRIAPDVKKWKAPKRIPKAWNLEQIRLLWETCARQRGQIDGVDANLWWLALMGTLYDTGERIAAVLSSRWSDYDPTSRLLTLPAEVRKGATADLQWRLHPETAIALDMIREPKREKIFVWPWDPLYIFQRYGEMLAAAGLPHGPRDKFHKLRRTVASFFAAAGGDATRLLGHSSADVTRLYLDPEIVGTVHASEVLPRPMPLLLKQPKRIEASVQSR